MTTARRFSLPVVVSLALAACAPDEPPTCLTEADAIAWPGLRYVTAARADGGVRVRGFSGAVPANTEVTVSANGHQTVTAADVSGRFDAFLTDDATHLTLTSEGRAATLRVRDLEDARACVAGAPVAVGTTPNDLEVGACDGRAAAFVPTSGDGALEAASLSGGRSPPSAVFPPDEDGRASNPFAVALHEDGRLAAVTLFGHHGVALVDACAGRSVAEARATDSSGEELVIEVSPPVSLANAVDADGDGDTETAVSRMAARHPQGVAFVGDRLLVSYTNLLQVGPPAVYGPGLVVAFDLDGDELRPAGHSVLPFQNPQAITLDDEGQPWVTCSGALDRGPGGAFQAASDGGLVRLEAGSLAVARTVALGRFAPGTPAIAGDWIVVGSLVEPTLARLPRGAGALDDGTLLPTGAGGVETLFEVVDLGGGLALATGFDTDALHVVDVAAGELHPWPFNEPLVVGPGDALFRGLKAVAITPPAARAPGAPDAAALLALSNEVVPLSLWQVLGP